MPSSVVRLQFVLGSDFGSRSIAWFTQGAYSHVDAVVWPDGIGSLVTSNGMTLQPRGGPPRAAPSPTGWLLGARADKVGGAWAGVQLRPPGYAKWARRTVIDIPCTAVQSRDYWCFLAQQLGKPYDSMEIWGFVFGRGWREDDSWICSEVQARAAEKSGVLSELFVAGDRIAPVPLALVASAIGGKVIEDVFV